MKMCIKKEKNQNSMFHQPTVWMQLNYSYAWKDCYYPSRHQQIEMVLHKKRHKKRFRLLNNSQTCISSSWFKKIKNSHRKYNWQNPKSNIWIATKADRKQLNIMWPTCSKNVFGYILSPSMSKKGSRCNQVTLALGCQHQYQCLLQTLADKQTQAGRVSGNKETNCWAWQCMPLTPRRKTCVHPQRCQQAWWHTPIITALRRHGKIRRSEPPSATASSKPAWAIWGLISNMTTIPPNRALKPCSRNQLGFPEAKHGAHNSPPKCDQGSEPFSLWSH